MSCGPAPLSHSLARLTLSKMMVKIFYSLILKPRETVYASVLAALHVSEL
jgi:hypothetical protein